MLNFEELSRIPKDKINTKCIDLLLFCIVGFLSSPTFADLYSAE